MFVSTMLLLNSGACAQTNDPRAQDAIDLYNSFCLKTFGLKEQAIARLGEGNAISRRLSDSTVQQLENGKSGGVAWTIRSPRNALLLLEYNPIGICAIRVVQADKQSILDDFQKYITSIESGKRVIQDRQVDSVRTEDGAHVTFREVVIYFGTTNIDFAITATERKIGQQQHLITFSLTH
jgi:hypothetical protein